MNAAEQETYETALEACKVMAGALGSATKKRMAAEDERDALVEQLKGMATQLDKYKEIAEENNGEHVKLEALREAIGKLVADMRVAEKEGSGNSATERNATHFWRLRLEDLEHYEPDNIRAELVALERDWRDAARMSNDPKSPSIWVACADEILRVLR